MRKVAFLTAGCKLNQYETEAMVEQFICKGWQVVASEDKADVYVINTCTVTHRGDRTSRYLIRRAYRNNEDALIVVTGCYAQVASSEIAQMSEVDIILGNAEKEHIIDFIPSSTSKFATPEIKVSRISRKSNFSFPAIDSFTKNTRAFIKIQDGCDAYCSYCLVPYARGPSRSQAPEIVIDQVSKLIDHNYQEIVLTGIHLGTYGRDLLPPTNLAKLLASLLDLEGLKRLRLTSLKPTEIDEELLSLISSSSRICRHLHISLQSGDDEILKAMRRRYTVSDYRQLIEDIKGRIPDIGLGTDVIVGFPGEAEKNFDNTYALISELPFTYLHVFPYSKRKGTVAATMTNHISAEIRQHRGEVLRKLSREKSQAFRRSFIGKSLPVLIERSRDKGTSLLVGFSDNYIRVYIEGPDELMNKIVEVRIERVEGKITKGTLVGKGEIE